MSNFSPERWTDEGSYYQFKFEQMSDEHLYELHQGRLGASDFATVASRSRFSSRNDLLSKVIEGKNFISKEGRDVWLKEGKEPEENARKWYENLYKVKVDQANMCVPKWNPRISGSPDGFVGDDGLIEIKCPKRLYGNLVRRKTEKYKNPIFPSHYDQMIGYMAITGRKWCDYVVLDESGDFYVERLKFNKHHWENILYPEIQRFLMNVGESKV